MSLDAAAQTAVERFAAQLTEQVDAYRQVLAVSEEQRNALDRNELDTFHGLLSKKATLMERVAALDVAMADNRAVWNTHRDQVPDATNHTLRTVVDELRALLEGLVAIEAECEEKLAQAKRNVQQELNKIGTSRAALESYKPSSNMEQTSRFLDLGG